jgi:hypothetical protein
MDRLVCHCELVAGKSSGLRIASSASLADCPDFGRLAGLYRWMEWASFGPCLQMCRCAWLDHLAGCRRALAFGEGDGRFTARLLRANRHITLNAIDASPAMLAALLRGAGEDAARVQPQVADARLWQPQGRVYDLVISHFFLDCLNAEEVRTLAREVRPALDTGAMWVISEFAIPAGRFGRFFAQPLIAALYWAFGLLTGLRVRRLPDYAAGLRESGFELTRRRTWLGGLLTSELWSAAPSPSA